MTIRSLAASVATASVGSYASILTGVVTNIFLARSLGATEYGRFALLLMASQLLQVVGSTWTLTSLVRFGAQEFALSGRVGASLVARSAILAAALTCVAAVVWLVREPLAAYLGVPAGALLIVGFHVASSAGSQTAQAIFQAVGRATLYGAWLFGEKALGLALLVVLALGSLDAVTAIAAAGAAAFAMAAGGLALASALHVIGRPRLERARVATVWSFSLPQLGGSWAGVFGSQWIDYVVIRQFLSLADLGVYAVAYQVAGTIQQLPVIVSTLLLPRFSAMVARGEGAEIRRMLGTPARVALLAFGTAVAAVLTVAGPLTTMVFGEHYSSIAVPLALLLVASGITSVNHVLNPALMAHGIVWPITFGVAAAVVVNVGLDLALIPSLGIAGAALATLTAYAVAAGLVMIIGRSRLGVRTLGYPLCLLPLAGSFAVAVLVSEPQRYALAIVVIVVLAALVGTTLRPRRADTITSTTT